MREAFAMQKLLTFFQQKVLDIEILMFEILTKRQLMTSLVLNNQAQVGLRERGALCFTLVCPSICCAFCLLLHKS